MTAVPASEHTEVTILGAMLVEPLAVFDAVSRLTELDFSLDSHQRIFSCMFRMHQEGRSIDITTVRAELERRRELDSIGGPAYLAYLTEGIPRSLNVDEYVQIVKEKSVQRELLRLHSEGQAEASDPAADTRRMIERTATRLKELQEEQSQDIQHVGAFLDEHPADALFEKLATTGGIKFGFPGLDAIIGGVPGGKLVVVAARPSVGKTAWASNAAHHIASSDWITALFTLEDDRPDVVRRMLSSASRVKHEDIKQNTMTPEQRGAVNACRRKLSQIPLYIDDKPKPTVSQIKSKCARLKRNVGLDAVLVDQLSKVSETDVYKKGMDKRQWVGAQTTALKQMAQELNVPVILFNQLSREVDKRTDTRPRLSDLKESGSIEEDADIVIFLHRPEGGPDQMIVEKHRGGPIGTVDCSYQGRIMRWEN